MPAPLLRRTNRLLFSNSIVYSYALGTAAIVSREILIASCTDCSDAEERAYRFHNDSTLLKSHSDVPRATKATKESGSLISTMGPATTTWSELLVVWNLDESAPRILAVGHTCGECRRYDARCSRTTPSSFL